ncbi:ATP-binding protein [Paenibacillus sp. FSL K6-2393]|uniref:ATP-binding protein n=1 Tax=Paenibacillus sp. FSL K6-2393 TaxID=2921475 RepID=UPI0030F7DFBA
MPKPILLPPGAKRMMESMRDVGYDLPTSIADLVDNSIEAGATMVEIDFVYNEGDTYVRIFDNGIGMSNFQILEALRYGTRRQYVANSLGKFGFGLKTASLSHCRKLYVASKQSKSLSIMMWDMDHVEIEDKWEALELSPKEVDPQLLVKLKPTSSGTSVMWKELDRVSTGSIDKETFISMCRFVEEHLSVVFHRFLEQKARRKLPLKILINGNEILPWDPFAITELETRALPGTEIKYQYRDKSLKAVIQPYILPPEQLFSSKAAHARAAGPKKWNRAQGFYIYRNDRIIQNGGWNRLRSSDEHTKLARIAIDFVSEADESFKIDIAKMAVQIPRQIRTELAKFSATITSVANAIYRAKLDPSKPNTPVKSKITTLKANLDPYISKAQVATDKISDSTSTIKPSEHNSIIEGDDLVNSVITILKRELADQPELLNQIIIYISEVRPDLKITLGG